MAAMTGTNHDSESPCPPQASTSFSPPQAALHPLHPLVQRVMDTKARHMLATDSVRAASRVASGTLHDMVAAERELAAAAFSRASDEMERLIQMPDGGLVEIQLAGGGRCVVRPLRLEK